MHRLKWWDLEWQPSSSKVYKFIHSLDSHPHISIIQGQTHEHETSFTLVLELTTWTRGLVLGAHKLSSKAQTMYFRAWPIKYASSKWNCEQVLILIIFKVRHQGGIMPAKGHFILETLRVWSMLRAWRKEGFSLARNCFRMLTFCNPLYIWAFNLRAWTSNWTYNG